MAPSTDNRPGRAQQHQDAAVLATSQQSRFSLLHGQVRHGKGWEHGSAGQQAGCPGNLRAGMLSRAAGELMNRRWPQDHGGRAAWKPTHSDAHPWSRAVGEGSHSLLPELSCGSAAWGAGRRGELPAAGDGTAGHGQEPTLLKVGEGRDGTCPPERRSPRPARLAGDLPATGARGCSKKGGC